MHRRRDVLHLLRADIGELHRQLVGDLLVHRARNTDAADLGEALQSGCDVDAVAQQVAVALDHVADGDADAKAHVTAGRIRHVARAQALLDVDRAQFAETIAEMEAKLAEKEGDELDHAIERLDHFKSIQHELSATAMH